MVRFLVYANEYEVEGLVATTSTWLRDRTREDLIRRQLDAYGQVRENLLKHASGFPTKESLLAVTCTGQTNYGMAGVGDGKTTAGSRRVLAAADRDDARPLWVSVWGGANTLAQALWDARKERSPDGLRRLVAKLRVYTISDQDDAGPWLRREFPDLFYIVSPSTPDWKEYWRATWTGISGDRHYRNGPHHHFALVDNPWLEANVINDHGPLGALYPKLAYIMEGDTPSFLGLIENGLGWSVSPAYGGWGGRYALYQAYGETRPIWTNNQESRDTVTADNGQTECTDMATLWRWREHFQHDFAARMDWCVAEEFKQANHNPVPVLNGDKTKNLVEITAQAGETVKLSAEGTGDPDGNTVGGIDIDGANNATDIELSPDGATAYVVDQMFNSYHVFSTARGQDGDPTTVFGPVSRNGPGGVDPPAICIPDAFGAVGSEGPFRRAPQAQLTAVDGYDPVDANGRVVLM